MNNSLDDTLLRISEVAKLTGLSKATIYRHVSSGAFPAQIKIGGAARWSKNEIEAWIAQELSARKVAA